MTLSPRIFNVQPGKGFDEVIRRLRAAMPEIIPASAPKTIRQTHLDTFDWRLSRAGVFMTAESEPNGENSQRTFVHWTGPESWQRTNGQFPAEFIPKWARDIPAGTLHDYIEAEMEMRALIAQTEVSVTRHDLPLIRGEDKTVVRLTLEDLHLYAPRRKTPPHLGTRLKVTPVRGYDNAFDFVMKSLASIDMLSEGTEDVMARALAARKRKINDYSSKITIRLDGDMRTDAACRHILLGQLDQMEANVEGTIKDIDSEFLHDLRVAVRRSRSLLSRVKGAFPDATLDKFASELSWLGQITGPTRDMDVYLLDYPEMSESLHPLVRDDLAPLHEFLIEQQALEQKALADALGSKRFKDFLTKWRAFLEKPLPRTTSAPNAMVPVKEIADARIWKTYRRVIKEGSVITDQSEDEALHDLRKTCKKLRYLLEFFASLYPEGEVKGLVKTLKGFQENLGTFQDITVQSDKLRDVSHAMMEAGQRQPEVYMAMGMLVNGFLARKNSVRAEFKTRFAAFADPAIERRFKKLCKSPSKPAKSETPAKAKTGDAA